MSTKELEKQIEHLKVGEQSLSRNQAGQQFGILCGLISTCGGQMVWEIQVIHVYQNSSSSILSTWVQPTPAQALSTKTSPI